MKLASLITLGSAFLLGGRAIAGDDQFLSLHGDFSYDYFGAAVCGTGDVDKDGYADFAVGAPSLLHQPYVRIFSGRDGYILRSYLGSGAFGDRIANAGDVNNDSYPDLLVGGDGTARVYSGKDGKTLFSKTDLNSLFGFSLAGAGDVNKDGFADFLVGAPYGDRSYWTNNGYVQLISGKTGAVLNEWYADHDAAHFGWSVASGGDINKDGYPDVLVGAPDYIEFGAPSGGAWVFSGKTGAQLAEHGGQWNSEHGWTVAGGFDINHDGYPDYAVGAPQADSALNACGMLWIYSGKDHAMIYQLYGSSAGAGLGLAIDSVGDLNGDHYDDIMFGQPGYLFAGIQQGSVTIMSGKDGSHLRSYYGNPNSNVSFGSTLCGVGDVNHDGQPDYLIGDLFASDTNDTNGSVTFYSGKSYPASWNVYGSGYAGKKGIPTLTASNNPEICRPITLNLTNSAGINTVAAMFIGPASADLPTSWGGHLLVALPWSIFIESVPTQGLELDLTLTCDITMCGLDIYLQALESDQGASQGVSFTPGLKLVLGM